MSAAGFIRLLFLKDLRRYKWPLAMIFAMELVTALSIRTADLPVFLAAIFAYLTGLYLTMDIIQIDWPGRDLRFLFTRPVPSQAIFFAKILFLGLFLIVTGWGFKELDYAVLGMPLQPLDHLYLLIETTIFTGAAMALVALFSLFLRKKSQVFFTLLALSLTADLAIAAADMFFPRIATIPPHLNQAQHCWSAVVLLLGLSGFIWVNIYLTHPTAWFPFGRSWKYSMLPTFIKSAKD